MIRIRVFEVEATVQNRVWQCKRKDIQDLLRFEEARFRRTTFPGPSDPYGDWTSARHMVDLHGAEILEDDYDPDADDSPPGRVY